jgi:CRP/FNR family transcriptional regulator, cyclic AMP receptor protein
VNGRRAADVIFDPVMLRGAPRRRFRRGEVIFHADDLGDTVHVIEKGRVAIRVTTPLGNVATVSVLGSGELFGEGALFSDDARRSATAVALEPVETRPLNAAEFARLRATDPRLDDFLMHALTARLRRTTDHLIEALFVPVERRVLHRLVTLADEFAGDNDHIVLSISQEDLAAMAGTTRPTANRVLRAAERDGLITLSRGHISIVDRAELARRTH